MLAANLTEYGVPVGGRASVWAEVTGPAGAPVSVALPVQADGTYRGAFVPSLPGVHQARVRAAGRSLHGRAFTREKVLTVVAAEPGTGGAGGAAGEVLEWLEERDQRLCETLRCLLRSGALKEMGLDVERLDKCLQAFCRPPRRWTPTEGGRRAEAVEGTDVAAVERAALARAAELMGVEPPAPVADLVEAEPPPPDHGHVMVGPMFGPSLEDIEALKLDPENPVGPARKAPARKAPAEEVSSPQDSRPQEGGGQEDNRQEVNRQEVNRQEVGEEAEMSTEHPGPGDVPARPEVRPAPYNLEGTFYEACDCWPICPCWVGRVPDENVCTGVFAWSIERGRIDGVRVDGRTVASISHHAGNRDHAQQRVVLFVDDDASDARVPRAGRRFLRLAGRAARRSSCDPRRAGRCGSGTDRADDGRRLDHALGRHPDRGRVRCQGGSVRSAHHARRRSSLRRARLTGRGG